MLTVHAHWVFYYFASLSLCLSVCLYSCLHVCVYFSPGSILIESLEAQIFMQPLWSLPAVCYSSITVVCVFHRKAHKNTHIKTQFVDLVSLSLLMINEMHNMYLSGLHLLSQRHIITVFLTWLVFHLLVSPSNSVSVCTCVDVSTSVQICSPVCVRVFMCTFICRARIAPFPLSNLTYRAAVIAVYVWLGPRAAQL